MITSELDTKARILHLEFPKGSRIKPAHIPVKSVDHAMRVYQINLVKYITNTLNRWVKQREWALKYMQAMTPQHQYAIDRLKLMLEMHMESQLPTVIRKVVEFDQDIRLIAPSEKSRYYSHYLRFIYYIRCWCRNHYDAIHHPG